MQNIKEYVEANKQRFLDELFDLLRLPSVSADLKFKGDVEKTAEFVAQKLREAGADNVEVCPTAGNPIVYGEKIIDPALPTVLTYGHHDVQPADPYELWDTPPFEPTIRDGKIYARGSADDKGQFYMHVKAFEYMVKNDALACNIKFMIEGEEEVGSVNLGTFVKENTERLKADVIVISDTSMVSMAQPSLETGLRGLSYVEVEVTGPNRDLHSGVYGGAVANPATILAKLIASLHDENNHITIPGFYDVGELTTEERKALKETPFDIEEDKTDLGIQNIWG